MLRRVAPVRTDVLEELSTSTYGSWELSVYIGILSLKCNEKSLQKVANRPPEDVTLFEYLEMAVANQNLVQEEIKRRLKTELE
jgi:hypothetical protein